MSLHDDHAAKVKKLCNPIVPFVFAPFGVLAKLARCARCDPGFYHCGQSIGILNLGSYQLS